MDNFKPQHLYAFAKLIHWTKGAPMIKEFKDADFARKWFEIYNIITNYNKIKP